VSGILQLARNALLTNRAALQIVGHNIVNANTPGYVRQRPVLAVVPGALSGTLAGGGVGQGVELVDVQRLADELLQAQVERQEGRAAFFQGRYEALAQVEALFTDLQGAGIAQALGDFFDAFEQVASYPSNLGVRTEALQRAEILTDTIRQRADELYRMRDRFDEQISRQVAEVNRQVEELAALNSIIGQAASPAARADIESQQDRLVAGVARLIGAEAIRYDSGVVDLLIGGQRLVQGGEALTLRTEPDPAKPGRVRVVFDYSGELAPLGGEIAGLAEVRDDYIDKYISWLDTLAQTLADEINAIHLAGFDLDGNPGVELFTYGENPARSLELNVAVQGQPELLAASDDGAPGNGSNALAIAMLAQARLLEGGEVTLEEYYADFISEVGTDTAGAQDLEAIAAAVAESLQAQYQSQAGVSLDEEGMDLIRYQQAYEAASRILMTALEMFDAMLELR